MDPWSTPVAAFVRPQVAIGKPAEVSAHGGFGWERVDRQAYYAFTHPQTIEFEIAREIVRVLTDTTVPGKQSLRKKARTQLFPQVLRIVKEYVRTKIDWNGQHRCELGLDTYANKVRDILVTAIEPDDERGEPPPCRDSIVTGRSEAPRMYTSRRLSRCGLRSAVISTLSPVTPDPGSRQQCSNWSRRRTSFATPGTSEWSSISHTSSTTSHTYTSPTSLSA